MKRSMRHGDGRSDGVPAGKDAEVLADLVRCLEQADDGIEAPPGAFLATLAAEAVAATASHPEGSRSPRPLTGSWRRRAMIKTFLSTLVGKLVVGGAAVALATGGMAATGTLPDPAQRVAAETAAQVGLELPSPDDPARVRDRERTRTEEGAGEASGTQTQTRVRTENGGPGGVQGTQTQTRTETQSRTGTEGAGSGEASGTQTQTRTQAQTQTRAATGGPGSGYGTGGR